MAGSNDIDKILQALEELRIADERHAKEAREADERHAREAREADDRLRDEIKTLSGTLGNYQGEMLEVVAAPYVMRYLEVHEGLQFTEMLLARYAPTNGRQVEFDLYGKARRRGGEILIIGEVKRNPTPGDVAKFDVDTTPLVRRSKGKILRLLFCGYIDRNARKEAAHRGVLVIAHRRRRR